MTELKWLRASGVAVSILAVLFVVWAWTFNFSQVNVTDYLSYWAAGKLALAGEPAAAWDVERHRQVEFTLVSLNGLLPFPYPPPFLLMVTLFSLLSYMWGFAAWVTVTGLIYFVAARRVIPAPYVLAQPPALINGWIGQNGFVTSAIFVTGVSMLKARPFAAGAVLGLLVIKPQIALLLPVAVIAARLWPAIAGAAASAGAMLLVSLVLFGPAAFEGFWNILPLYGEMMRNDKWPWNEFISVFAFLRWFGASQSLAMIVHGLVAAVAAILTWQAWAADWEQKVPLLASATLLIPPYLLTYDALLLILPMGYWLAQRFRPGWAVGLWVLSLLPITFYFNLYRGPSTVPLAAILALFLLVGERRASNASLNVDHAHAV
jgi:alpha-1,2-mannosyltransferase